MCHNFARLVCPVSDFHMSQFNLVSPVTILQDYCVLSITSQFIVVVVELVLVLGGPKKMIIKDCFYSSSQTYIKSDPNFS